MTEQQPSKAQLKRRLERVTRDYEAAKARLAEVGFTCEGSLAELYYAAWQLVRGYLA